ncbi:MAG: adenylosuccinate synthetase [Bacilli bacterium]|nr:adenylosuccinate synthetase [Bacilli bacterium]
MNDSYIVSGSMFGDEGKGTLCDYLAHKYNLKETVRYNGGSQASHTVIVDDKKHKFSQLGSGMLNETRTYLSDNTIINPFNIITEAKELRRITGRSFEDILKNIYIDENASIVTPYHALINQIRELSLKENSLGSVGTGVSEVYKVKELTGLDLKVKDLISGKSDQILSDLFRYTSEYYKSKRELISDEDFESLINEKDIYYLTTPINRGYMKMCYANLLKSNLFNIVSGINEFHKDCNVLFEGSQGLLIDREYGIKPNTTSLDTTNHNGIKLANAINTNVHSIGCTSILTSRHGKGVLITHDKYLDSLIHDENQLENYFQGSPRYGWFDAVLFRYSTRVNPNNYYFLSGIDRLNKFETIKICQRYKYYGEIDDEFNELFDYYYDDNTIFVHDIKKNSDNLKKYLLKCIPDYIELKGFDIDFNRINDFYDLPYSVIDYINLIEMLCNIDINIVGIGPDRSQKLERRLK